MKYVIKNGAVSISGETILESINLEINEKSHIGVVGKNGAGKTTLLQCIVDNSLLEEGTDDTSFQVIKQGNPSIGYLRQIELNDNNTMLEEVRKPFRDIIKIEDRLEELVREMNTKDDIKLVEEYTSLEEKFQNMGGYTYRKEYEILIKNFGFKDSDKFKYLKEFSGGEKTKIAFIKMLLNKPDILLLDEPLGALDLKMRKDMQIELKEMHKKLGITFIYVTHDQEEALTMSDTIVVMKDGVIQQIGSPKQIYDEPKNAFVADFIGESNIYSGTIIDDNHVAFLGHRFECVDKFPKNEKVDVVIRPEDIFLMEEGKGMVDGMLVSKIFKGVN